METIRVGLVREAYKGMIGNHRKIWGYAQFEQNFNKFHEIVDCHNFCLGVCAKQNVFFKVFETLQSLVLVFLWTTASLFGRKNAICQSELGLKG